ncbi:MAG: hypothetical protein ACTTI3_09495 [Treponema sp.]|jgi:hypothetical protein
MKKIFFVFVTLLFTGVIFAEDPINGYITCIGESADAGRNFAYETTDSLGEKIVFGTLYGTAATFTGYVDCLDGDVDLWKSNSSDDDD